MTDCVGNLQSHKDTWYEKKFRELGKRTFDKKLYKGYLLHDKHSHKFIQKHINVTNDETHKKFEDDEPKT